LAWKLLDEIKDRKIVPENLVKDLLRAYEIKTPEYRVVSDIGDLENLDLPFPLALKMCSDRILHKTDVGGVALNIQSLEELKEKLQEFRRRFPGERFLVETMEAPGVELIVGLLDDSTFGLSIMVGLGGVFAEAFEDVTFRVLPITREDAEEMLSELKGKRVLEGFRGIKVDREKIVDFLLKVSRLGEETAGRIKVETMDLNPVFAREKDVVVVDAKLVLKA
jgi:acyl-CoA synthetase (NDP forming)